MASPIQRFFTKWSRQRGITLGNKLAVELRRILSVQAPTRISSSGRVVAITPATPGAPPRKVSGRLQRSVKVKQTERGCKVVVGAPYARYLNEGNHPFIQQAMQNAGIKK